MEAVFGAVYVDGGMEAVRKAYGTLLFVLVPYPLKYTQMRYCFVFAFSIMSPAYDRVFAGRNFPLAR